MKRPDLLVCLPAAPFPARRNGIAIRYAPILQHLQATTNIDVIQIASPWAKPMTPGADAGVIRSFAAIHRPKPQPSLLSRLTARARTAVFPFPPHARFAFDSQEVVDRLQDQLQGRRWDTILWVTTSFAREVLPVLRKHATRVVLDAIDSIYSNESKQTPVTLLGKWDLYWLGRWEVSVAKAYDQAIYISLSDISDLENFQPDFRAKVSHIPNGVMIDDFIPEVADPPPFAPSDFIIGYLGHMAYPPNIRAALRLKRIFDRTVGAVPNAKLMIIGRSPAKAIQALADDPRVIVTGTVDSIWPYVNRTDVFVFPMETGAGQQNKVMEAMYAKKAVVTTPIGNRGIGAVQDREILIAETDEDIIRRLKDLSVSACLRARVGQAGRAFIEENYSWDRILPRVYVSLFPQMPPNGNH